jgi:hypothetical protein
VVVSGGDSILVGPTALLSTALFEIVATVQPARDGVESVAIASVRPRQQRRQPPSPRISLARTA